MGLARIIGTGDNPGGGGQRPRLGDGEAGAALVGQVAEGDALQTVTGGADFLVDLISTLQRRAVIGAEQGLELEVRWLVLAAGRNLRGEGRRGQAKGQTGRQGNAKSKAHVLAHLSPPSDLPSTDWAIDAGSGFGVSNNPTKNMIGKMKAK